MRTARQKRALAVDLDGKLGWSHWRHHHHYNARTSH